MALFGKKNKKEEITSCGCCGNNNAGGKEHAKQVKTEGAGIIILGSGCSKCNQLEAAVREALEQLHMDMPVSHITDFTQIAAYGVMSTPALVIEGKVASYGKVLKVKEVVGILQKMKGVD